ncbi:hypothetical protein TIFTF001_044736 [Ficus carica]|uniref:Uncharacterized protein n=1 Tax=Ficus carica TaxID=3494 RepID=A0AA87ZVL7_FICCA|nr:hypothetical protein TIFTF001_044736 [Ficus carica]
MSLTPDAQTSQPTMIMIPGSSLANTGIADSQQGQTFHDLVGLRKSHMLQFCKITMNQHRIF